MHVSGATECYATLAEAQERAAFLRSVGYVPWVDVRVGATTWVDADETATETDASEYADKSDPDAMPSADDVAEMIVWADTAKDEQAFARFMERANGLLDRAYMSSRVGYAQSAIETAKRALAVARDDYATGEANHVIGEATRLIDRLNNSYAAAKGRY
ncbi:hypothetical protein SEA_NICHOLASP3_142 [Mycobacterium phage Nicholasp3]|nr:hypothetical protein SEA_NICHOLASP3_142 [Mycobacterium phage Nicholasp3]